MADDLEKIISGLINSLNNRKEDIIDWAKDDNDRFDTELPFYNNRSSATGNNDSIDKDTNDGYVKSIYEIIQKLESLESLIGTSQISLDDLLNGDAKGTESFKYLDPTPFVNKFNKAYSKIKGAAESARTDPIEMNVDNMDYTNESESEDINFLRLLMPQYARRVEVEDLDKNFWVIGTVLNAVVDTLFGSHIPELLSYLIKNIAQGWEHIYQLWKALEELENNVNILLEIFGVNDVNTIECGIGDDMITRYSFFSAFPFESLTVKLKSGSGERTLSGIINNDAIQAFSYCENENVGEGTSKNVEDWCKFYSSLMSESHSRRPSVKDLFFPHNDSEEKLITNFSQPLGYFNLNALPDLSEKNDNGKNAYLRYYL